MSDPIGRHKLHTHPAMEVLHKIPDDHVIIDADKYREARKFEEEIISLEKMVNLLETKLAMVEEEGYEAKQKLYEARQDLKFKKYHIASLDHWVESEQDNVQRLTEVIKSYIRARVNVTQCRQERFKRLCQSCPEYDRGCRVYSNYFEAWINLQISVLKGEANERT